MSERFSLISDGDVATSAKYGKPRSTHSLIWRLSATQTPSRSSRSPSEPASASRRALEEIVADSNYLSAHVVFTAHSLPARILNAGDPYQDELLETARLVAEQVGLERWSFSYQSASPTGEPWLGPDILDHLDELAREGVRDVLICPVGFVSDHLEIRWDLDTEAVAKADDLGLGFSRIQMPNDDPAFIQVLAGLVRRAAVPSPT